MTEYLKRYTDETYENMEAPAPPEYWERIKELRAKLDEGTPVAFVYAPGNGTAYEFLIVPKQGCANFGAWRGTGTEEEEEVNWAWVAVERHANYVFHRRRYKDAEYVGGKLGLKTLSCGLAVATVLNDLFDSWGEGRNPEEQRLKMYQQYGHLPKAEKD